MSGHKSKGLHAARRLAGSFRLIRVVLGLTAALVPTTDSNADRIETSNGRIIEGIITKETPGGEERGEITVRVGNSQITLQADQIRSLIRGTQAENQLIEARNAIRAEDYESAVGLMHEIYLHENGIEGITGLFLKHVDPLLQRVENLDRGSRQKLAEMIDSMDRLQFRYDRELTVRRAQYYLALGLEDAARHQLGYLDESWFRNHSLIQHWIVDKISSRVQDLSYSGDFEAAKKHLELLKRVDTSGMAGRLTQLKLQEAYHLRSRNQFEAALQLYIKHLFDDTPEIARDRIRVTLEDAEKVYMSDNKLTRIVGLLESYGLVYVPEFSRERLGFIWMVAGRQQIDDGDYLEAEKSFNRAKEFNPKDADHNLSMMEYRRRQQDLGAGDLIEHYELGVWALEEDLFDQAEIHFRLAAESELVGDNASAYLETINQLKAERELLELIQMYEEVLYDDGKSMTKLTDVIEGLTKFMDKQYPLGYVRQAVQLKQLVKEALRLRAAERPQQAEALFQKAQRAYYSGHVSEAKNIMEAILVHYQNTVVYPRVRNFYTLVREKDILEALEKGNPTKTNDLPTTGGTSTGRELQRVMHDMNWLEKVVPQESQ